MPGTSEKRVGRQVPGGGPLNVDPAELLASLRLTDERTGDDKTWGELAYADQWEDAEAIFDRTGPRRHYLLRGRGMSKTTDLAAVTLALLLAEAPPGSRIYCYAVDQSQASLMIDVVASIVSASGLGRFVDVGARTVIAKNSGATMTVASSDGASSFGTRPWLTVVDELGAWPNGANHRQLWSAIISAVPKVPQSRLVVITTAGSPTGLGATVWEQAQQAPQHWRTVRRPGPSPWWTEDDITSVRASLTESEWRRLILCEWAESDDALTTADAVAACTRPGSSELAYRLTSGPYVAALDVGTRRDLTALAVGHTEQRATGRVVVIDRVMSWRPTPGPDGNARVDLAEVEQSVLRVCAEYRISRLRFDRMQAEQLTANLGRSGVRTAEYVFSTGGANRLARSLYIALRDRAVELPDDEELITELQSVRMVETGPGTVKMQNPPGTHDDVAVAVAMVVADLTEQPDPAPGRITRAPNREISRAELDATPTRRRSVGTAVRVPGQGRRSVPVPGIRVPTDRS